MGRVRNCHAKVGAGAGGWGAGAGGRGAGGSGRGAGSGGGVIELSIYRRLLLYLASFYLHRDQSRDTTDYVHYGKVEVHKSLQLHMTFVHNPSTISSNNRTSGYSTPPAAPLHHVEPRYLRCTLAMCIL